jgi:hypothetical protein
MKVKVTEEHIRCGKPGEHAQCPIALAIREQYGFECVSIGSTVATLRQGSVQANYALPSEATRFIINFDKGRTVSPMEFEL